MLQNRRGGSDDDLKVTFDTGAVTDESLVAFNGEDGQGNWTIHVSDRESGDTGTFNSWSLIVEGYLGTNFSTVSGSIRYEDRPLSGSALVRASTNPFVWQMLSWSANQMVSPLVQLKQTLLEHIVSLWKDKE